jgi:Icc-related predicted phosphoesterase
MRVVCISDTHSMHYDIGEPADGDLLIHAGDFTRRGLSNEAETFADWMSSRPHKHKVVIAGNHDLCAESHGLLTAEIFKSRGIHYLRDSSVTLDGTVIYGSPWQPFFNGWAFNVEKEEDLYTKFREAPTNTDILITHGPPWGVLDRNKAGLPCGSTALRDRILEINPILFVCGHIHESRGVSVLGETRCVNASCVDTHLRILRSPEIVIDLPTNENGKDESTPTSN